MQDIEAFKRTIVHDLFSWTHSNYCDYKKYVLSILEEDIAISPQHKKDIVDKIDFLATKFDHIPCNFGNMRHIAQLAGEEILQNLGQTNNTKIVIEKIQIEPDMRDNLDRKFSIKKLDRRDVAYKWWVARVIAREILWIPHRMQDIEHTLKDVDLWVKVGVDHEDIMDQFGADSEGIGYVEDFSQKVLENVLQNCDITINQIFVTQDTIYITDQAKESLKTWVVSPLAIGKNFFGSQSYTIEENTIFHPRQLLRSIKFLIESKIDWVIVPEHNIQKNNLEKMNIDMNILVFVRRIYQKHNPDKRTELLFNFAQILKQWWIIQECNELFGYMLGRIESNKFLMTTPVVNIAKDSHWKLSKYIGIALDDIVWDAPEEKLADYDFWSKDNIILKRPETVDIPEKFYNEQSLFEIRYGLV